MKLTLTMRRARGIRLVEVLSEGGRSVVRVPRQAWKEWHREVGGVPFGGPTRIARMAAKIVEARMTNGAPPEVPEGMSCDDLSRALKAALVLLGNLPDEVKKI